MRPKRTVADRVRSVSEHSAPRTGVRLRVVGMVVVVLFALMFIRLWYLQVLDTSAYDRTVDANQQRVVQVAPPRGLILDRSGAIMVGNVITRDITLSRVSAEQHPAVVDRLAAVLGLTPAQIRSTLANPQYSLYKPVPILTDAPMTDILYIAENAGEFPGVSTAADSQRTYPLGATGGQVLGYTRQITSSELAANPGAGYQPGDIVGQAGLESQYERVLRGKPGSQTLQVDAQGQVVGVTGQTPPVSGDDLVTNLDSGLEQTLQNALEQQMASLRHTVDSSTGKVPPAPDAAAVALDPQTGAVLALVSAPSYDPSIWNGPVSQGELDAIEPAEFDNAISGVFTPGSTFKLVTATAALNDGVITPDSYIDDPGSFTIPDCKASGDSLCTLHDSEGSGNGPIDVTTALSVSSDVFFYNLGYDFWLQSGSGTPIQDVAAQYGLESPTGIDLPGESTGIVDSLPLRAKLYKEFPKDYYPPYWSAGDNVELAFGQGTTAITPIEQADAYATFANGGTRYRPEVAAGVVTPSGKVVDRFAPVVTGHVPIAPVNRAAMLDGFIGAVQGGGTASGAFAGFPFDRLSIAGKTGTASHTGQVPTSWFVGWGPVSDPQYLILVVVDQGGYGATAAAPVVRAGFEYLLDHPLPALTLAPPSVSGSTAGAATPTSAATTTKAGAPAGATGTATTTVGGGQYPPAALGDRPRDAVGRL